MSTQVETRVRRANPVASDSNLDQLFGESLRSRLRADVEALKEGRMTDRKQTPVHTEGGPQVPQTGTTPPETRRVRWGYVWVGITAAALLVIFGPMLLRSDSEPPATVPATTVTSVPEADRAGQLIAIAQRYMEARNARDVELSASLVTDRFITSDIPNGFGDGSGFEGAFGNHRAYGFQWILRRCMFGDTPGPERVECIYGWNSHMQEITGVPPVDTEFHFLFDGEMIMSVVHRWEASDFGTDVWARFIDFLDAEDPDMRTLIELAYDLDPEIVASLEQRMPDLLERYRAYVNRETD